MSSRFRVRRPGALAFARSLGLTRVFPLVAIGIGLTELAGTGLPAYGQEKPAGLVVTGSPSDPKESVSPPAPTAPDNARKTASTITTTPTSERLTLTPVHILPADPPDRTAPARWSDLKKFRVQGLLQFWVGTAFGDGVAGNAPGTKRPQGRNYGGGSGDLSRIRRARLTFSGGIVPRMDYRAQVDLAPIGYNSRTILNDLWVGYQLTPQMRVELGQQKTGLTEEGTHPEEDIYGSLTVARSIMNEDLPPTAGRIGAVRDVGLMFRYRTPAVRAFAGLWQDNGATQSRSDNNAQKFLDGGFFYTGIPHVTLGLWGGTNVFGTPPLETRDRGGGTFLWQSGPHFLEAEVAYARDYAPGAPAPHKTGSIARGGYLLYAHRLSRQWQLVARYDNWDPAAQGFFTGVATTESGVAIPRANHKLREYTLGVNYYIPKWYGKIQVNYIREDTEQNGAIFFGKQRTILLTNLQVGFDTAPPAPEAPGRASPPPVGNAISNGLRLGAVVTAPTQFAVGIDVAMPKMHLLPGFSTRITGEVLSRFDSPSFLGFPDTLYAVTLDQAYRPHDCRLYGGFGLGPYFGEVSRLGGKLFFGWNISSKVGAEATLHFAGAGDPFLALQTRLRL